MESYNLSLLTKRLFESEFNLISSKTLREILGVKNERTYYRIVNDFISNEILVRIEKDKYYITNRAIDTFEIANFLYQPSYISLETALNYWGILSQFPFEITSVTVKKSIIKNYNEKKYSYGHVASKYFGMFTKKNNILIALPEKALFDQLYFASKGIKLIDFDEYDLSHINRKTFFEICHRLNANKEIINLSKKYIK
ncbi:hypothetical protein CO005_00470 [Candidatus Roizmanbacteria bacterium CG_4_8_14_3_um_filter_34_9]|uniref:AbiEi antitoxin C-terminal domain-containing protein n=3 Tax=Candidatus Roizmaniibacteriota TaxID=1752723 RepID=A0A2M7ATQ0_9BACT|nr:MAG: hypothetical protein COT02_00140 [Candidatus Roizmanbacteria bacterium CG07_land_8_20_14_0_80_34_15]PIU73996.1 MAG: hypothetical protein COS77_03920 [Candidatus Roizmanbacteria bacterium CG06_land_8_20_14_3_00_34_14]PIW73615.1 MAG: hypothetical protein CO005_00470 [Candidatus Roizmanbacteria bacterium CG_4_8_14_3_um_filter_34_9]